MKTFYTIMLAIVFSVGTNAQNFPYLIEAFQEPYQPLESPIDITNDELWDDPEWMVYPPFPIYYLDDTLTDFMVSAPGNQISQDYYSDSVIDILIPYMADLMNASPNSMVSPVGYEIVGNAPNRIFKIEWSNAGFYDEYEQIGSFSNLVSFQLWLYETSGNFRVHFGPRNFQSVNNYQIFGKPTMLFSKNINISSIDYTNEGFWTLAGDPTNPTIASIPMFSGFLSNDELLFSDPEEGQVYYFFTESSVSTKEHLIPRMDVYPNPAMDYVFLQSDQDDVISVFDSNGKLVMSEQIKKGTQTIHLSGLMDGLYVLKSMKNPTFSKRISKL
jgi:hypothetical protein